MLGNLYKQRGDLKKAQSIYQKGLSIYPQDAALLQASQP